MAKEARSPSTAGSATHTRPETFFDTQSTNVENALWAGVRSLEEQATLSDAMAARALKQGDQEGHDRFQRRRQIAEANAGALRDLLLDRSDP